MDAGLGESPGQLLVEGVQPADVREDHHPRTSLLVGMGGVRGESVAVLGCEDVLFAERNRASHDRGDRRTGAGVVAHGYRSLASSGRPRGEPLEGLEGRGADHEVLDALGDHGRELLDHGLGGRADPPAR